jgi:hypothetical protein
MKILESTRQQPTCRRLSVTALYLAGVTAIVGWSLQGNARAAGHEEPATRRLEPGILDPGGGTPIPKTVAGSPPGRANCASCGVIEEMRTLHRQVEVAGQCAARDSGATSMLGGPGGAEAATVLPQLADIVALATTGRRSAGNVGVSTRYQVVVRMRNGSKRVLDEETPRSLRVGERVQIIDGATAMNG